MVLVSLKTESTIVNVRVDDLAAGERVRINEAIRIIQSIVGRTGSETVSLLIGAAVWFMLFFTLGLSKTGVDLLSMFALSLGLGFMVGCISWGILHAIIESRNSTDALNLIDILRLSQRSKELYTVFLEASPPHTRSVFQRIMSNVLVMPVA